MIQIGGVYTTFCQKEGILLQKYRDRNGSCIAILFKSIGVRGRFDSPKTKDTKGTKKKDRPSSRNPPVKRPLTSGSGVDLTLLQKR